VLARQIATTPHFPSNCSLLNFYFPTKMASADRENLLASVYELLAAKGDNATLTDEELRELGILGCVRLPRPIFFFFFFFFFFFTAPWPRRGSFLVFCVS
jgi:hypothetical protein